MPCIVDVIYRKQKARPEKVNEVVKVRLDLGADASEHELAFYDACGRVVHTTALGGANVRHRTGPNGLYLTAVRRGAIDLSTGRSAALALLNTAQSETLDFRDKRVGSKPLVAKDGPAQGETARPLHAAPCTSEKPRSTGGRSAAIMPSLQHVD